jgi:two-component system nitrate/nitrite response regulator NarL
MNPLDDLTAREREVLHWLAEGDNNREIAIRLHLSESTIKWHLKQIMPMLNVTNRVQAAVVYHIWCAT